LSRIGRYDHSYNSTRLNSTQLKCSELTKTDKNSRVS